MTVLGSPYKFLQGSPLGQEWWDIQDHDHGISVHLRRKIS